jgi:hypothetical protein
MLSLSKAEEDAWNEWKENNKVQSVNEVHKLGGKLLTITH